METKKLSSSDAWVDPDDAPLLTREFFEKGILSYGDVVIRRGRPSSGHAKQPVSLRLDPDVIEGLRGLGPGWQARAAEALRDFVAKSANAGGATAKAEKIS